MQVVQSFDSLKTNSLDIKRDAGMKISIIIGSTRNTPTGKQIADNIVQMLPKISNIDFQVVFVNDYDLPFYVDATSPASRKDAITDPVFKKWSDLISVSSGFILVAPEYNGGYPAPLKNALDCLYQEWNHKPVGIIGYSGGTSGGSSMIAQLKTVCERLEMVPVATAVKIPQSWKAFNKDGILVEYDRVKKELLMMVDELVNSLKQ